MDGWKNGWMDEKINKKHPQFYNEYKKAMNAQYITDRWSNKNVKWKIPI